MSLQSSILKSSLKSMHLLQLRYGLHFSNKQFLSLQTQHPNESSNVSLTKSITQPRLLESVDLKNSKLESKQGEFATLLRNSTLVHLGDIEGQKLIGCVYEVVKNDLYIDFGGKFHCVCPRPEKEVDRPYVRGSLVLLRIRDFEMASRFMLTEKAVTLLETDCILLGHYNEKHNENVIPPFL